MRTRAAVAMCVLSVVAIDCSRSSAYGSVLDGRIAYATYELNAGAPSGSVQNVYVSAPDGSGRRLVARDATDPAWSRDGKWLAYVRDYNQIRRVRADGTGDRLVARGDVNNRPVWSPDGKWIAYSKLRSVLVDGYEEGRAAVYVSRRDGTHARKLHRGAEPAWSHDGRTIAFNHRGTLAAIRPDGSRFRVLRRGVVPSQLEFSPTRRELLFRDYTVVSSAFYSLDLSTNRLERIPETVFGRQPDVLTWTPDGDRYAYFLTHVVPFGDSTRADSVELHVVRPDGMGHRMLARLSPDVMSWDYLAWGAQSAHQSR